MKVFSYRELILNVPAMKWPGHNVSLFYQSVIPSLMTYDQCLKNCCTH